uniref:Uncharacterized protein n=1 Tax=Arabidopsis thaliana TaxID=3702 RepID=Q8GXL9_ARATH|nr:unknown protein [Arabidopsis thaliana]
MLQFNEFGNRWIVFSKDSLASLLTSMHLTELKSDLSIKYWVNLFINMNIYSLFRLRTDVNNLCSCLHFLDVANDNPITPAPAYRSATDDPPGTYLCSFQSKLSKA